jgi:hypothetical protein|tara:strand:+ start:4531 stop:5829 length:1299 start_codon:yes stop_codon:yes gene_type:complete
MAKQTINIGTYELDTDNSVDTIRAAFKKANENFSELYNDDSSDFNGDYSTLTNKPTIPADVSDLTDTTSLLVHPTIPNLAAVNQSIIPDTDVAYDLGSFTNRFRDLHLSGNTIFLGGSVISTNVNGQLTLPPGTSIPGVAVEKWIPDSIIDSRGGATFYNEGDPILAGSIVIDHVTFLNAQGQQDTRHIPTVYAATIDSNGLITDIAIGTAYHFEDLDGDSYSNSQIATDNMIAIDPGIDINDPVAIAASSQLVVLAAAVASVPSTALAPQPMPKTVSTQTQTLGRTNSQGQFIPFIINEPVTGTLQDQVPPTNVVNGLIEKVIYTKKLDRYSSGGELLLTLICNTDGSNFYTTKKFVFSRSGSSNTFNVTEMGTSGATEIYDSILIEERLDGTDLHLDITVKAPNSGLAFIRVIGQITYTSVPIFVTASGY